MNGYGAPYAPGASAYRPTAPPTAAQPIRSPLLAPRPQQAPTTIPTDALARQADSWRPSPPPVHPPPPAPHPSTMFQQPYSSDYGPPVPPPQPPFQPMPPRFYAQPVPPQPMPPQNFGMPQPQWAPPPPPSGAAQPSSRVSSLVNSPSLNSAASSFEQMSISPPQQQQPTPRWVPLAEGGKMAVTHPDRHALAQARDGLRTDAQRVAWAKQVLRLIERHQAAASESTRISDPVLVRLTSDALTFVLNSASSQSPVPLALFLRGDLAASGTFPTFRAKDAKLAFRDFEAAANAGYARAWFRIGRAYEQFGDLRRAVTAYERGADKNDCACTFRLAMAHLLAQIGVPQDTRRALALIARAADLADIDSAEPPYVYGLMLAGEFQDDGAPGFDLRVDLDQARRRIEYSAYLGFGPAQYKMGYSYESASLGCLFDPTMSVQYYALASQNGEVEADMALSRWYLSGSNGNFDKNEKLAFTFAEKAASRGLPTAEFAVGYYKEVGINGPRNIEAAKSWYARAAAHGNTDARDRLESLARSQPLSREEHEAQVDVRLVRKHTQAHTRSQQQRQNMQASSLAATLNRRDVVEAQHVADAWQQQSSRGSELAAPPAASRSELRRSTGYQLSDRPAEMTPPRPSSVSSADVIKTTAAKPETFAELGIATAKASKDDCIIM